LGVGYWQLDLTIAKASGVPPQADQVSEKAGKKIKELRNSGIQELKR
jgi:hypothetical protein